jgi:hypothetical protein
MTVPAPAAGLGQVWRHHYEDNSDGNNDDDLHEHVTAVAEQLLDALSLDSTDDAYAYATPRTPNLIVGSPRSVFAFPAEPEPRHIHVSVQEAGDADWDAAEASYSLWAGTPVLDRGPAMWGTHPSVLDAQ